PDPRALDPLDMTVCEDRVASATLAGAVVADVVAQIPQRQMLAHRAPRDGELREAGAFHGARFRLRPAAVITMKEGVVRPLGIPTALASRHPGIGVARPVPGQRRILDHA